jgi:hypothetical protein
LLYALAKAPANLVSDYVQAVQALLAAPFRAQLLPLDHDEDFIYYAWYFGWGGAPDFHPRVQQACSLDRDSTADRVGNTIDRIQGKADPRVPSLAESMTRSFINLYERVVAECRRRIDWARSRIETLNNALTGNPPADMAANMREEIAQLQKRIAEMQAMIPEAQAKADILNKFLQTLQSQ